MEELQQKINGTFSGVSKQEITYVAIGFLLSMIHWVICIVYFAALLLFIRQGIIGCTKALLIITTRGILSTAVSSNLPSFVQAEKMILIFIFVFFILFSKDASKKSVYVSNTQFLVVVFMLYCFLTAFFTSSYPIVSVFKAISYAIPFCAVLLAVSITNGEFDWINYLFWLMTPVMVTSAITIPFGNFRIVNDSFQGVINHPNLFGIVGAIYIVTALYNMMSHPERAHWLKFVMTGLTFVMIYLSESRTGMFSSLIMLIIYFVSVSSATKVKVLAVIVGAALIIGILFVMKPSVFSEFTSSIDTFITKRAGENGILGSRERLIQASMEKFHNNEWLGSGFGVPFKKGVSDYQFSFDIKHETGNLPTALLGDCGIIGSIIFYGYMLYILFHTKRKNWILFFLPIIVSFGEQAFFATNNIAIYYYVFYGICLSSENSEAKLNAP